MKSLSKFVNRLENIGIAVELAANHPWIYLVSVNSIKITERFQANHGFTAFYSTTGRFSDRRTVFKLIRKYYEK